MREKLREIVGSRCTFTATFQRYGQKPAFKGPPIQTLLFVDVRNEREQPVCDHVWFRTGKRFEQFALLPGARVSFRATSKPYLKGYRGRRDDADLPPLSTDYKLSHPGDVQVLDESAEESPAGETADAKRGTRTAFSPLPADADDEQLSFF